MQPAGSELTTGTLYYSDPAVDGAGLFYQTDKGENLLFKNEFSDDHTQYLHYKDLVGLHSRLTFSDTGESGCTRGMIPCPQQTPLRIVKELKLEKL